MKREEKKQETVARITEAARRLFSEKGYESTTVAQIAEAAGVAKGTFFNYFRTKDDVLIRLQKALFFSELSELADKSGPYTPRILALVKEMGDSLDDNRTLMRLSLQRFLSDGSLENSRCGLTANLESMIPVFTKGQQTGEFTAAVPAAVMAHTAIRIYLGALMTWSTGIESEGLGEQLLLAFQIFLAGVAKKA